MKTILHSLLALWLVMSLASCASDTASDVPVPAEYTKAYLQMKVTIAGNQGTRADNPLGGEDGNGREEGQENENKLSSLAVLLYQSTKDALSDEAAKIDYVYTFDGLTSSTDANNKTTWQTGAREVDPAIVGKNYHVLVIANTDDISALKGKTIADIRDKVMSKVCTRDDADVSKFSDFVMSSSSDAKLDFSSGNGTEADPYVVSADIERLAARIDIIPNSGFTDNTYYYNVESASGKVIGGFKLESVVPTKVLNSGEYLIKRVSADAALSSLTYFGKETMDASSKKSTNYVVCPLTGKTTARGDAQGSDAFYQVKDATYTDASSTSSTTSDKYFILDYLMENTTTDNAEAYSTGLLFKGKYYEGSAWDATNKKPVEGATATDKEYTYVIRHSDPTGSGTISAPMYYGMVRNNIYRIKIDGIQGTEPDGIKLTLNVVPWTRYEHEEVIY